MKQILHSDPGFEEQLHSLATSSSLFDPDIEQAARNVIQAVRERGDEAVLELTRKYDHANLSADQLPVTLAELLGAAACIKPGSRNAIRTAHANIRRFSQRSLRRPWSARNTQKGVVGEKYDPFMRVGVYVPGGTAPLVSTALMTVTLAEVAGCPEIVVCTPGGKDGVISPTLLYAMRKAGATEIYRVGGAQAIAAMALGTSTIKPVQKIFGPGNAYVVAAKRLLFGHVAVDLLPGPSEVLAIADDSAFPDFVAADLLAQAEHGSGHERVWLVTTSKRLLRAVASSMRKQLPTLSRRAMIEESLRQHGALILARDLDQAIAITNQLAPEHCEIHARRANFVAQRITTAGAIFIGPYSPTVLGDYVAGPSHTLPTGGGGRCFAGLTVDQFQRRTSVVTYDRKALQASLEAVRTFAAIEGLDAHAQSAAIRLDPACRSLAR